MSSDSISTSDSPIITNQKEQLISEEEAPQFESLEIENPPTLFNNSNQSLTVNTTNTPAYPSNFFSNISFQWIRKTLIKGRQTQITTKNIPSFDASINAHSLLKIIKPLWYNKYQFQLNHHPLFKTVVHANYKQLLLCVILNALEAVGELIEVTIFRDILRAFETTKTDINDVDNNNNDDSTLLPLSYLIVMMILCKFLATFLYRFEEFTVKATGASISIQIKALIYDKLLQVATYNKSTSSEGELINNIQIDAEKFADFLVVSPDTLILPFQLTFYIYLLFKFFGFTFLFGFACLALLIVVVGFLQKKRLKMQKLKMEASDIRMKKTTQAFNIIKTIKLYSWENAFYKGIQAKRDIELKHFHKVNMLTVITNGLYWSGSILLSFVSISFQNILSGNINTANVMTAIYIFTQLSEPLFEIPNLITELQETIISLTRIETFLRLKNYDGTQLAQLPKDSPLAVQISNVSFGLDKDDGKELLLLKNINLSINKGELISVVGEVGSGKSCLLNAILNNLHVYANTPSSKEGNIKVSGKVSYISQNPWILNDTIKNNILFFNDMDEKKYTKVIEMCELQQDIQLFEGGDMTEIGEKGIGLSGGQKARLVIARALYNDADIFLFDDPLSALDAYVGMKIFNQVFQSYLKDKTRIIVTHALQYISHTDKVIYMHNGEIAWFGPSNELKTQKFYNDFINNIGKMNKQSGNKSSSENNEEENNKTTLNDLNKNNSAIVRTTKDEELKRGGIKLAVWYSFYMYAGGLCFLFITVGINIMYKLFEILSDYFVSFWADKTDLTPQQNKHYLFAYFGISFAGIIFIFIRAYLLVKGLMTFNIKMHDELLFKLIRAPVNLFHDVIPRGQILTRLGKDLDNSSRLNMVSSGTMRILSQLFGCIIVCAMFNIYSVPLIFLLLLFDYYFITYFVGAARDLNRLEGNTRSPILSVFSETLPGIPIIRAFSYEGNFVNKFYSKLNDHLYVGICQSGGYGWLSLRLDLISFVLLVFILLFSLFFQNYVSTQTMGLLLSYSIKLIDVLYFIMNRVTILEQLLTSVERCTEFTKIVQELPPSTQLDKEIKTFPQQGKVEFINYSAKYRPETELVLKNMNVCFLPGEKIGVVGRTGSGKSTMCLCLFRILEAHSGCIKIDNIDISKLGLNFLRENLTVIPQEPTLIEGTLRDNVDPSNTYNDKQITDALVEVGLGSLVKEHTIEYEILENGKNLSIGEKQLVCIARAMLRKSKIILMDEATSSIDYKTEKIIQNTINKVLEGSTVITIAHRINTIINYDKILVLANGEVAEFDTPENLLKNKKGLFSELYKESAI